MWVGILLAGFLAIGGNPQTLTSWQAVADELIRIVSNPYILFTLAYTIFAIINNPEKAGKL